MGSSHIPKRWRPLVRVDRRSPEWIASRYESIFVRAASYAKSKYGRFPEPMRSLLKSLQYEELSPIFRKAVISVQAQPFRGGLHQTYSWPHIACSDWKELGGEIIERLQSYLRSTQREQAQESLARIQRCTKDNDA